MRATTADLVVDTVSKRYPGRSTAPALDQLTAGQRVRFEPRPPPGGSERALLGELRGWLDRARVDWAGWDVADA